MVGWQRHLQSLVRQVAKRYDRSHSASFSTFHQAKASLVSGEVPSLSALRNSLCPPFSRPLYSYIQKLEFTSSRSLLADASEGTPVSSPLIPVLPSGASTTETQKTISKASKVQAILKKIKQVIHSARANATHNHGLDPDRLLVAEAFVGKGRYLKRVSYHARGKSGIRVKPECRLTVVLREITPEEEAKIAKLKVHNFRKLSKREKGLCLINLSRPLQYGIAKANLEVSNQAQWQHKQCRHSITPRMLVESTLQ